MRALIDDAIKRSLSVIRDPESVWTVMADRYGEEMARETRASFANGQSVRVGGVSGEKGEALGLVVMASGLRSWGRAGFPVVVLSEDDALSLAHTEPPAWMLSNPIGGGQQAPLGVTFGRHLGLILDWRLGSHMWLEEHYDPFGGREAGKHFVANVGFVLLERPEGLDIREHRPSPKAMRKQGRRHYSSVQYIIQAARDPHPPEPQSERGPRDEGWTQFVRSHVRGHWRQQAHGPGWSQHKTIWIRPTWRGPLDAPISIHPTRISSVVTTENESDEDAQV